MFRNGKEAQGMTWINRGDCLETVRGKREGGGMRKARGLEHAWLDMVGLRVHSKGKSRAKRCKLLTVRLACGRAVAIVRE